MARLRALSPALTGWLSAASYEGGGTGQSPFIGPLNSRQAWLRICVYSLFFCSAFSIAGVTAATLLLYLFALYHAWREPPRRTLPGWLLVGILTLPAVAVICALVNPSPLANVIQLRKEYSYFLPLVLLPALALMQSRRLLIVLMIPVVLMAVYALIQYFWGVDWIRPEGKKLVRPYTLAGGTVYFGKGTFTHHLTFSGYMLLNLLLFAGLALRLPGRDRLLWGVGAVMAGIGVIVALGRSGWIGMAVGLLLLVLGFPRRIWLPLGVAVAFVAVAGSAVLTGWHQLLIPSNQEWGLVERFRNTSLRHDRERLYLWESALLGIQDRPVFGVGYGNDKLYMRVYRKQVTQKRHYRFSVRPSTHSHNVYLQVAFELGLLGLVAYLALWGSILYWSAHWVRRAGDGWRFETALLSGAAAALTGSMVAGFFENNFFDAEVRTMIFILMGLALHSGLRIRAGLNAGQSTA